MSKQLPVDPADLTPDWLTRTLRNAGYDVTVAAVSVAPIGTGQTGASYRLDVTYREAVELPSSFVVKLAAMDPDVRERVAFGYRAEVAFYDTVADTVRVPLPRCWASELAEDAQTFVLLLDDLAPAIQGDQLRGCSPEAARRAVIGLAGLHGPRWSDPSWHEFTAAVMQQPDAETAKGIADLARMAADMFITRLGDRMTPEDRATLAAYPDSVQSWLLQHPDRFSLLHGDYRLDNLMFAPDGTVTVVDWQTLTVGLPARDLAYFLATSLTAPDRRAHEEDLVAAYHQALVGWGVADYDLETCRRDYALGTLHAPLITTLGAAFSTSTERGDEMTLVMLERACPAIRELGALELVAESGVIA